MAQELGQNDGSDLACCEFGVKSPGNRPWLQSEGCAEEQGVQRALAPQTPGRWITAPDKNRTVNNSTGPTSTTASPRVSWEQLGMGINTLSGIQRHLCTAAAWGCVCARTPEHTRAGSSLCCPGTTPAAPGSALRDGSAPVSSVSLAEGGAGPAASQQAMLEVRRAALLWREVGRAGVSGLEKRRPFPLTLSL